jgi:hypothetical protein
MKTPNTAEIPRRTLALMKQWGVDPTDVLFDIGGGGKQHADVLREQGYAVRTIAFGGAPANPKDYRWKRTRLQRIEADEVQQVYCNRRAEMYGVLRQMLHPDIQEVPFGIPAKYTELRRQLAPIPLLYDGEGRLYLPPKTKRNKAQKQQTMTDLIGCSPDEADSLVLATFGLVFKPVRRKLLSG